ncbi:hypothetical protein [Flavobacterium davisii]|uniref:hypothetical protein n=1 Tax=Flavobacterium davisii TaxID=2906077 RepID=UPI002164C824|nr:hypothetical protein [Flavobacterium davisii]
MKIKKTSLFTIIIIASLVACNKQDESNETTSAVNPYELRNHSVTPPLIKAMPEFSSLQTYSLFSSEDKLVQTPDYVFGGSADGSGLIRNTDDTFTFLVNNEDNFAVSKITFDKTFKPVAGQYILNSNGAGTRLCSATLATPEIHGFGPLFLTCGESNSESLIHGLTPLIQKQTIALQDH